MAPQPSASWKLKAISVPFCSVHTMSVSVPILSAGITHNLDILSYPVVSDNRRLSRSSSLEVSVRARPRTGHIFSLHPTGKRRISMEIQYGGWMMSSSRVARCPQATPTQHNTHIDETACTEPCPSIKPVVILELVYFYAFAIVCRSSGLGHNSEGVYSRHSGLGDETLRSEDGESWGRRRV